MFGYEINVYSDHKNLVHEATLIDSQSVMRWETNFEEFGPNIIHIAGVDNIVADTLSSLRSSNTEEENNKVPQKKLKELYATRHVQHIQSDFLFEKRIIHKEKIKELEEENSKLKANVNDSKSKYYMEELDGFNLVMYDEHIYIPLSLRQSTLNWYHHYCSIGKYNK